MDSNHLVGGVNQSAVLAQNVAHHVVVDPDSSDDYRVHRIKRYFLRKDEVVSASIVSLLSQSGNDVDDMRLVVRYGTYINNPRIVDIPND